LNDINNSAMRYLIFCLLFFVTRAAASASVGADGQLAQVFDGDTIEVRLDEGNLRLRLHAIDTPDLEQVLYFDAADALRKLVGEQRLRVVRVATTYGRLAGVIVVDGTDINGELIRAGFAYAHRKYLGLSEFDNRYCTLEHEARVAVRGIWALPPEDRIAPWQLRQYYRGQRTAFTDFSNETIVNCNAAAGRPDTQPGTIVADPIPGLTPPNPDCLIKADISASGKQLYYVPGMRVYAGTFINEDDGERWFCSENDAKNAGWERGRGR